MEKRTIKINGVKTKCIIPKTMKKKDIPKRLDSREIEELQCDVCKEYIKVDDINLGQFKHDVFIEIFFLCKDCKLSFEEQIKLIKKDWRKNNDK